MLEADEAELLFLTTQIRIFFGKKRLFTIEELFDWSFEVGWDEFWMQGQKHTAEETNLYELLNKLQHEDPATVSDTMGRGEGNSGTQARASMAQTEAEINVIDLD